MNTSFSGLNHALTGIQTNLRRLELSAYEIGSGSGNLAGALVDGLVAARAIEASASIVKRIDETLGHLIDTTA